MIILSVVLKWTQIMYVSREYEPNWKLPNLRIIMLGLLTNLRFYDSFDEGLYDYVSYKVPLDS